MKRLLIDMDNCITDPLILEYINEFKNTNYKLDEQTDFYLQNLVTRNKEQFWKFLNEKNLYENAELKDNCYETLKELNEIYDIYIVTSYLWKDGMIDASGNNLANKYNYLNGFTQERSHRNPPTATTDHSICCPWNSSEQCSYDVERINVGD